MAFRIGISRDYLVHEDRPAWPGLGVDGFEGATGLELEFLPEKIRTATPQILAPYDALISSTVHYTPESFMGLDRLAIIARFGVGYDTVNLEAATGAGVLVTI